MSWDKERIARLPLKWPGSQQAPAVGTYLRLGLRV